jgi:DNA-binding LacI/PurR family transcriptional regulator
MTVEISDRSEESDLQGIRRLLRRKVKPTALFANNDYTAANAMSVAKALGMAVPADLAVVGYDNSYLSRIGYIDLSTVDNNYQAMGTLAAQRLVERIQQPLKEKRVDLLDPVLRIRSTSDSHHR